MLGAVDKSLVDRGDPYDQRKIQELEEKMDETWSGSAENLNKNLRSSIGFIKNKKVNIKNSKRF